MIFTRPKMHAKSPCQNACILTIVEDYMRRSSLCQQTKRIFLGHRRPYAWRKIACRISQERTRSFFDTEGRMHAMGSGGYEQTSTGTRQVPAGRITRGDLAAELHYA